MSATKQNYERQIPPMKFINGNYDETFRALVDIRTGPP